LDGPSFVTVMVKVLPVEPAVTVSGSSPEKSFTTSRSTTSTIVTVSESVTGWVVLSVSLASAEAVFVLTVPPGRSASAE
jgi:hypothetical protein